MTITLPSKLCQLNRASRLSLCLCTALSRIWSALDGPMPANSGGRLALPPFCTSLSYREYPEVISAPVRLHILRQCPAFCTRLPQRKQASKEIFHASKQARVRDLLCVVSSESQAEHHDCISCNSRLSCSTGSAWRPRQSRTPPEDCNVVLSGVAIVVLVVNIANCLRLSSNYV